MDASPALVNAPNTNTSRYFAPRLRPDARLRQRLRLRGSQNSTTVRTKSRRSANLARHAHRPRKDPASFAQSPPCPSTRHFTGAKARTARKLDSRENPRSPFTNRDSDPLDSPPKSIKSGAARARNLRQNLLRARSRLQKHCIHRVCAPGMPPLCAADCPLKALQLPHGAELVLEPAQTESSADSESQQIHSLIASFRNPCGCATCGTPSSQPIRNHINRVRRSPRPPPTARPVSPDQRSRRVRANTTSEQASRPLVDALRSRVRFLFLDQTRQLIIRRCERIQHSAIQPPRGPCAAHRHLRPIP